MNGSLPLLLGALLLSGASHSKSPTPAVLTNETIPSTTVEDAHLKLRVEFNFDAGRHMLRVRYLLDNRGKTAVALFDRGDSLAVEQHRLKAGAVATTTLEQGTDGLTLSHRALPLRKPAPTVPPVPLAARVDAGSELGGDILADVGTAKRVRYCLGVAPFDTAMFSSPQPIDGVDLWRASFKAADTQRLLCTPWFDLAQRAFTAR